MVLKSFAAPEPLNIFRLKTRVSNPEGDNKTIFKKHAIDR